MKKDFDLKTAHPNAKGGNHFSVVAVEVKKYHLFKDGDMWCATFPDFINLQESDAGFGETPTIAIAELTKSEVQP